MGYEVLTSAVGGVQYGLLRPSGYKNLPLLVHLGLSFQDTLLDPVQDDLPNYLINAPRPWCAVSLDLPCHGAYQIPGARPVLDGWFDIGMAGGDLIGPFLWRVERVIEDVRARGIAHAETCAVSGISRGGFMALHIAQAGIMENVVGLSPVTRLSGLSEFGYWQKDEPFPLDPMQLRWVAAHISISNRDTRVGWEHAVNLYRAVSNSQGNAQLKAWDLHLGRVFGDDGHVQVPDAALTAARWILNQWGEPQI